jgi:ABC-type glutathione transport system ATPase component
MPMAYNSLIGDMGSALSGGQKQRILLTRALYRRPRLLFIDEGTSHLDVRLEERVNAAVQNLGLTRVSIAHRPQTLASADRVLHFTGRTIAATLPLSPQERMPQDECSIETGTIWRRRQDRRPQPARRLPHGNWSRPVGTAGMQLAPVRETIDRSGG